MNKYFFLAILIFLIYMVALVFRTDFQSHAADAIPGVTSSDIESATITPSKKCSVPAAVTNLVIQCPQCSETQ